MTLETSRPPVWPVPEYEYIGTQFGAGHRGTDIAAREGVEILAVWDGTVLEAEYHENWGDYVLLDHGGGIITRYAHCSELLVQPGDTVKAGEAVARVGNTGVASGNHCHLELERNGDNVWELRSDSRTQPDDLEGRIPLLLSGFLKGRREFIGTPTELSEKIDPAGQAGITPKKISRLILQSIETLRKAGITATVRRSNGKRIIYLKSADSADNQAPNKIDTIDPVN